MLTGLQYDYDVDLKIYGTVSLSMLLCVSCFPLMIMDVIHNCKFNNQSIYILFEIEFSPAATPLRAAAACFKAVDKLISLWFCGFSGYNPRPVEMR